MLFAPLSLIATDLGEGSARSSPCAVLVTADDEEQVHSWPHHKCANKKPRRLGRAVSPTDDAQLLKIGGLKYSSARHTNVSFAQEDRTNLVVNDGRRICGGDCR